jgi:FkbM family methyltransferase
MSITSYAQNFEDVMLWRALGHIPNGFYIDVGAQHPVVDSVSKAFYEHGWRGVHVEATPIYAELMRADRPDELVLQTALGDQPGALTFYEIPDTGLSTGDPSIAEHHRSRGYTVVETAVPCITLADVFAQVGRREVHWLKIDVEGMEPKVLAGWGDSAARPWIAVVESTYPNSQIETHHAWEGMLLSRGYAHVYFDGLSRYYVLADRADLLQKFGTPPNVFDGFSLALSVPYNAPLRGALEDQQRIHLGEMDQERKRATDEMQSAIQLRAREEALSEEIFKVEQRDRSEREDGLSKQISQAKLELEILLRDHVKREQVLALQQAELANGHSAQLLTVQQQASREKTEQARIHREQVNALYHQHADREKAFSLQLQAEQLERRCRELDHAQREKEYVEHGNQSRATLEILLRNQIQREQDVIAQLLAIRQQAEQEKSEQACFHREQELALRFQHAEREQSWARQEKAFGTEVAALQSALQELHSAQQLRTQKYDAQLSTNLNEHTRLAEDCAALGAQLKAENLANQQTSLRLRQTLAEVQQRLTTTHASFTWRVTSPMRAMATFIRSKGNLGSASPSGEEPSDALMTATAAPASINIQHVSIESIMLPSIPAAKPPSSTTASTLDALLACHDQRLINCAYQTLLGRAPDPEGFEYYLRRLRAGYPKIQLIKQLRYSPEGKKRASNIPGLISSIQRYRNESYPLIGWLFRALRKSEANHPRDRKLRSIESLIINLSEKIESDNCELLVRLSTIDLKVSQNSDTLDRQAEVYRRFDKIESLISEISIKRALPSNETLSVEKTDVPAANSHPCPSVMDTLDLARQLDVPPKLSKHLGNSEKRFFFNISTSRHWKAHPVGIIRVERELASYLRNFSNVEFVYWDSSSSNFKLLESSQTDNILSSDWVNSSSNSKNIHDVKHENQSINILSGDTFISLGLDWDLTPMHEISKSINNPEITTIFACYDLVPILFPEFCVRTGFDQLFKRHFVEMAHCGTHIFVDSDNSRGDLAEFLEESKLEITLPSLDVIPLASYAASKKQPILGLKDSQILSHLVTAGEYVIYVSSFEARKNHRLLINIWRDLFEERGKDCPQLVIVGMRGWGVSDLLNLIPRMPVYLAGKINWLQDVGDDLLVHLYKNCSFSVFPSIYEGWGLAATEAMSFGKVCIVSNNSALIQATQYLMPSYHPFDYLGWKKEIARLLDDTHYRLELETKIKNEFITRTWDDFSEEFCGRLLAQYQPANLDKNFLKPISANS